MGAAARAGCGRDAQCQWHPYHRHRYRGLGGGGGGGGAEKLCTEAVLAKYQKKGIEDFGYGKGYVYVGEEFGKLIDMLTDIINLGVNVVLTAHATMRKFEQPDEMGAYDRWEMKLSKKVAPMLKEWADLVIFANYRTIVVTSGDKKKAQGGERIMYTTHHPCWDAKNRFGLPEEMQFDFAGIAHLFGPALVMGNPITPPACTRTTYRPAESQDGTGTARRTRRSPSRKSSRNP